MPGSANASIHFAITKPSVPIIRPIWCCCERAYPPADSSSAGAAERIWIQ